MLNSKARNDKCGVCGGDNSSCKTMAGTFNDAQYGMSPHTDTKRCSHNTFIVLQHLAVIGFIYYLTPSKHKELGQISCDSIAHMPFILRTDVMSGYVYTYCACLLGIMCSSAK